jgi:thiosulfate reductase cytochrome b subunit
MNQPSIKIIEKHSRVLRVTHWLNVPLLMLMIWSGILIYWADQAYIKLPVKVVESFNINFRLAEGMGWHFFIMWPLVINGIVYISYLILSGEWRYRIPDKKSFSEVLAVILHELKIKKSGPAIRGKYNAAQRFAYTGTILMGVGSLLTGLAIYKPVQLGLLTAMLGGYKAARFEHFILMLGFVFFFVIHIIQVARAGWNNFRSMLAGYEIEKK